VTSVASLLSFEMFVMSQVLQSFMVSQLIIDGRTLFLKIILCNSYL